MEEKNQIFIGNNLKKYFEEIRKYDLLNHEEEIELAKKIEKGDKEAFDKMVKCNLRLVVKIAQHYVTPEWKLADLIQEGNIGLIKTVKKFDYRRDVRFSTYASWWIKQSITRSMSNKRRAIRLPHRKEEKLRKINTTFEKLSQELNRKPTVTEVAEQLGYSVTDIITLKNISEKIMSIDSECNNDGYNYFETIDDIGYSPEALFNKNNLEKETNEVLRKLKDNEREVIKSRFAFDRTKRQTLKAIAKNLGISTETVRQIEMKAIKKIKENYSYLKDYLQM